MKRAQQQVTPSAATAEWKFVARCFDSGTGGSVLSTRSGGPSIHATLRPLARSSRFQHCCRQRCVATPLFVVLLESLSSRRRRCAVPVGSGPMLGACRSRSSPSAEQYAEPHTLIIPMRLSSTVRLVVVLYKHSAASPTNTRPLRCLQLPALSLSAYLLLSSLPAALCSNFIESSSASFTVHTSYVRCLTILPGCCRLCSVASV